MYASCKLKAKNLRESQKIKRRESKYTNMENYSKRKAAREEKMYKRATKLPENNKISLVRCYLSTITLNVNELNSPLKRHRVTGWIKKKKKKPNYMIPVRHSLQVY